MDNISFPLVGEKTENKSKESHPLSSLTHHLNVQFSVQLLHKTKAIKKTLEKTIAFFPRIYFVLTTSIEKKITAICNIRCAHKESSPLASTTKTKSYVTHQKI